MRRWTCTARFGVLNAAVDLHCAELETAALTFITAHMAAVSEGAEWLQMTEKEAASLARETHSLSAVVEGWALLEALGRWVEYLPNERRGAFVQSMASEDAMKQNNLGLCYEHGVGVAKDLGTAVAWYTKAAEQENTVAQCNLGHCYHSGEGVAQDFGKAVELYTKAAEQGCARGQNNLGICYEEGQGVAQDSGTAVVWYTKAAEQGYARAQASATRTGMGWRRTLAWL